MPGYELAQINIARMRAPLEDPIMAEFVAALESINALAEASPGFRWRLTDDEHDASSYIQAYDDPLILVNMSVWADMQSLRDYVYKTLHMDYLKRGRAWFEPMKEPHLAMWWVPAGNWPSVEEAKTRLAYLQANGPSTGAFTFAKPFGPPSPDIAVAAAKLLRE